MFNKKYNGKYITEWTDKIKDINMVVNNLRDKLNTMSSDFQAMKEAVLNLELNNRKTNKPIATATHKDTVSNTITTQDYIMRLLKEYFLTDDVKPLKTIDVELYKFQIFNRVICVFNDERYRYYKTFYKNTMVRCKELTNFNNCLSYYFYWSISNV